MSSNSEYITLPNLGILKTKIPQNLYLDLLDECLNCENNERRITGLTSAGVPNHYVLEKNLNQFKEYIGSVTLQYEERSGYLKSIKHLDKNCHLIIDTPWINLQKKNEFLPNHFHDGVISYSLWMKIPYDEQEEINYKKLKDHQELYSFEFTYTNILGKVSTTPIRATKEIEGYLIMFPSTLTHCVYPFYSSDDTRISISGNIKFLTN
jgi:hypothetical protein